VEQEQKPFVLGITGRKRHGKDTAARTVAEVCRGRGRQVAVLAFGRALKTLVVSGLGLPGHYVGDDEELKNSEDPVRLAPLSNLIIRLDQYLKSYGLPELTDREVLAIMLKTFAPMKEVYRFLLQYVGTDVIRQRDPDHWVKRLEEEARGLLDQGYSIIVSDVRFPNEADLVRRLGGQILKVVRPGSQDDDPHPSEVLVDEIETDFTIETDDVDELKARARQLAEEVLCGS